MKIFRKIRQDLAAENLPDRQAGKVAQYMRYAIGEILLVVIGILIALQINNWNVFGWTSYIPRTTTQQELISSGDFNLIKNDSIKSMILILKQQNENMQVNMAHMRHEYDNYLYDRSIFNRTLSPLYDISQIIYKGLFITDTSLTEEQIAGFIKEADFVLNYRIIKNGLKLAAGNNMYIKKNYASMEPNTRQLIQLINVDLNHN